MSKINQLCSRFLWHGNSHSASGARVNWKAICHPKSEGGLGLKDLHSWNQACILQNIWAIILNSGSLWIAWIHAYILKGTSFWHYIASPNNSWILNKILKLRNLACEFVEWNEGAAVWKFGGIKYKAALVWEAIRPKNDKVPWHRLIWSSHVVPKHSLIAWMTILNRLPTLDRLMSWGAATESRCVLCQGEVETRDHLFMGCTFSLDIWHAVYHLCGLTRRVCNWQEDLHWAVTKFKGKSLLSILLRVAWNAIIYHVWRERNNRLHGGQSETSQQTLDRIKHVIRIRLARLHNVKMDHINHFLFSSWGLPQSIFT